MGQTALLFLNLFLSPVMAGAGLDRCEDLRIRASAAVAEERRALYQRAVEQGRYQQVAWALHAVGDRAQARTVADCLDQILREGEVLGVETLGGGISASLKIELPHGVHGVFKTTNSFDGCYRHEIAAYRIDERLDFQTVPMTVLRTIDTQNGSLQYFVDDATPAYLTDGARRTNELKVLDFLIDNEDRHGKNWLFYEFDGSRKLVAIDHNLTFGCRREANLVTRDLRNVDPAEAARLRDLLEGLSYEEIKALLDGTVTRKRAVRKVEKARGKLIRRLNKLAQESN